MADKEVTDRVLESFRYGIRELQTFLDQHQSLSVETLVDMGAVVNTNNNLLEKLNDDIKDRIKTWAIQNNKTVIEGSTFMALANKITKKVLDTKKVKEFLGAQLSKFQIDRTELHVTYSPRP